MMSEDHTPDDMPEIKRLDAAIIAEQAAYRSRVRQIYAALVGSIPPHEKAGEATRDAT